MKSFFKTFGAALLAFVVGTMLMWFLLMAMFAGITSAFGPKPVSISPESVLLIDLQNGVVDSPDNAVGGIDFNDMKISSSNTILEVHNAIELAATDPNIKGIYMNFTGSGTISMANVEELRAGLVKFKESGKFIIAYNDVYSQTSYWLCSVADKVYVNPQGYMQWQGVAANVMFFKGLLDKLDADVQVIRHGSFKSAVEPYITDKMSPANSLQMNTMVGSIWNVIVGDIASSRKIEASKLKEYAETMAIAEPSDALDRGMVDSLLYQDQVLETLTNMVRGEKAAKASKKDKPTVNMVSLSDYIFAHSMTGKRISKNKIAVIYADGDIVDGKGRIGEVGGLTLSEQIAKARHDEGVKAVVLRVNSPGGSALASEVIWREMELCRQQKPLIVSMGGMAASGGYYISAPADVILADRTTLTGSIGVFGMVLNLEKTMRDKLGITVDVAKTNGAADMGSFARPLSTPEREYLQRQVESTYATFVTRVSDGRNLKYAQVDSIGQGRVWLGTNAREIGLVDGFGGLSDAILLAVDRAGIADDFRIYEIIAEPNPFSMLLSAFSAQSKVKASAPAVGSQIEGMYKYYDNATRMLNQKGIIARMPYDIELN